MAFKQPRVPEYRGSNEFLRTLVLWLKDFSNDAWTANRQREAEIKRIEEAVKKMGGGGNGG